MQSIEQWSDFQLTMANGRQVRSTHFVLHQWQGVHQPHAGPGFEKAPALIAEKRLGVVVPKRLAKKAVTRNLIRRQAKSLMQLAQAQVPTAFYVVRLRSSFSTREHLSASSRGLKQAVRHELTQLMNQIKATA